MFLVLGEGGVSGAWCRRCFWQRAFPHLRKLGSPKHSIAKLAWKQGNLRTNIKKIEKNHFLWVSGYTKLRCTPVCRKGHI